MDDFFKYLAPGEDDRKWGLYLNVAGRATIPPGKAYPSKEHPTGYYFTWERGRVLQEYQLVYITAGRGVLETKSGQHAVAAGHIMLLRPGEYHRYRPDLHIGWQENYIGFNGGLVEHFYAQTDFLGHDALYNCGLKDSIAALFHQLFQLTQREEPGFQQIASGMVLEILGRMVAYNKQGDFSGKPIETIVQNARWQIREQVASQIDLEELARQHHISYATFRKMFKKYTGMSPRQYHLELKLLRAKELILTTDKSIKEISQLLEFESIHYFSRFFKQKMGYSPTQLRDGV